MPQGNVPAHARVNLDETGWKNRVEETGLHQPDSRPIFYAARIALATPPSHKVPSRTTTVPARNAEFGSVLFRVTVHAKVLR